MTILGYDSTLPVTQDVMMPHVQAVRRGSPNCWLIGDMPYMTYQPSVETAIRCAGRFMAEAACDAVKLEGGAEMADRMAGIVRSRHSVHGSPGSHAAKRLGAGRIQSARQGRDSGKENHRRCQSDRRRRRVFHFAGDGPRPRVRDSSPSAPAFRSSVSVRDRTRTANCLSSTICLVCIPSSNRRWQKCLAMRAKSSAMG